MKKYIKLIFFYGKKYIHLFAVAEICILFSYGVSMVLPFKLEQIIDTVTNGTTNSVFWSMAVEIIIIFVVSAIFNFIYAFTWQALYNKYVVDVKKDIYEKILYARASFLTDINSGDLIKRIEYDSDQFIHVVQRNVFHFINSAILCSGIIIFIAFRYNAIVALMLFVAAVLPIIATRLMGKITEKLSVKLKKTEGALAGDVFGALSGIREIKLKNGQEWMSGKITHSLESNIKTGNSIRRIDFITNKLIHLINLSVSALIYWYSVVLIYDGDYSVGKFIASVAYIGILHRKFNWMLRIYLDWKNRKASIDRVYEVLMLPGDDTGSITIDSIESVEFKNVSFRYGSQEDETIRGLSFVIKKGIKAGLAGMSGAGKTTVINLLLKLYSPSQGTIYINGIDIKELDTACLRRNFSVVLQDNVLFGNTVRFNLCLGANHPEESVIKVLKDVDMYDKIMSLPNGLETVISQTGTGLSGGQKQRLLIARALLNDSGFFILDEATGALDAASEKKILNNILSDENRTVLMITHSSGLLEGCGQIIDLRG